MKDRYYYFTVEAAEKAAKNMNIEMAKKFCPLIKGQCRQDCASFAKARVHEFKHSNHKARVRQPRCDNALVHGVIELDH